MFVWLGLPFGDVIVDRDAKLIVMHLGQKDENTQGTIIQVGQEITGQLVFVQGAARCVCAGGSEASGVGGGRAGG